MHAYFGVEIFSYLIKDFFWHGYPYEDIIQLLIVRHDVQMSTSSLPRRLKDYGLFHRQQ